MFLQFQCRMQIRVSRYDYRLHPPLESLNAQPSSFKSSKSGCMSCFSFLPPPILPTKIPQDWSIFVGKVLVQNRIYSIEQNLSYKTEYILYNRIYSALHYPSGTFTIFYTFDKTHPYNSFQFIEVVTVYISFSLYLNIQTTQRKFHKISCSSPNQ